MSPYLVGYHRAFRRHQCPVGRVERVIEQHRLRVEDVLPDNDRLIQLVVQRPKLLPHRVARAAVGVAVPADADVPHFRYRVAARTAGGGNQFIYLAAHRRDFGHRGIQRGKPGTCHDRGRVADGLLHRHQEGLAGDDRAVCGISLINPDFAFVVPHDLRHAAGQQKGHDTRFLIRDLARHKRHIRAAFVPGGLDVQRRRASRQVERLVVAVRQIVVPDGHMQITAVIVELLDRDFVDLHVDVNVSFDIILHIFSSPQLMLKV